MVQINLFTKQKVQTARYKINKLQGYVAQHREYRQYVIITLRKNNTCHLLIHICETRKKW